MSETIDVREGEDFDAKTVEHYLREHVDGLPEGELEVPVKKILSGTPPEQAASKDSLSNPESLDRFAELAERL